MATCDPKEAKNDLHEENVRGLDCKFFNGLLWCNYANIRLSFHVKWITTVLHTLLKMLICVYKNIGKIHKNWPPMNISDFTVYEMNGSVNASINAPAFLCGTSLPFYLLCFHPGIIVWSSLFHNGAKLFG